MKTYYRIIEETNGLNEVSYSLIRSHGWFGRYVIGSWFKFGNYETVEQAAKMLKHNIECDLRDKIVKIKVIK